MTTSQSNLRSALDGWGEIENRLGGHRPALFLDYDGTLAPIAPLPELARLPAGTREVLRRLVGAGVPVVVVSGRAREDVAERVGLEGVAYAGSHGFDLAGPDGRPLPTPAAAGIGEHLPELIEEVAAALGERLAGVAGVLVEAKGFSVAVHYRLTAPETVPAVEVAVDEVVARHPELRKTGGKMVFEVRPALDWDKGRAVLYLLDALGLDRSAGLPPHLPIYLGDDETDEDAFRALADQGIGIIVGLSVRLTSATYSLSKPVEVDLLLQRILEFSSSKSS